LKSLRKLRRLTAMHLAVLIDAENARPTALNFVMAEAHRRGRVLTRRAYGNWRRPALATWDDAIRDCAFRKVPLDACAGGKNAADIALAIDAMDLLHDGLHDGFCIVSSDSDYAPLARRLRESSCKVFGFGEDKAPQAWRRACDDFIVMSPQPATADDQPGDERILEAVKAVAVDGVAHLSAVGDRLAGQVHGKLLTRVSRHPLLHVERRGNVAVVRLVALAAE
jgi:hypothetical protein